MAHGTQVSTLRKSVLLQAFSVDHVLRLRLHAFAAAAATPSAAGNSTTSDGDGDGAGGGHVLSVSEVLESATDAIWGEGGFGSDRAKLWRNWDLMLFWLELLQARRLFWFCAHDGGGRRLGARGGDDILVYLPLLRTANDIA